MTREARMPSSYICVAAPQASCCDGGEGEMQGGMKAGRARESSGRETERMEREGVSGQ